MESIITYAAYREQRCLTLDIQCGDLLEVHIGGLVFERGLVGRAINVFTTAFAFLPTEIALHPATLVACEAEAIELYFLRINELGTDAAEFARIATTEDDGRPRLAIAFVVPGVTIDPAGLPTTLPFVADERLAETVAAARYRQPLCEGCALKAHLYTAASDEEKAAALAEIAAMTVNSEAE